jgi:hypothetical protein
VKVVTPLQAVVMSAMVAAMEVMDKGLVHTKIAEAAEPVAIPEMVVMVNLALLDKLEMDKAVAVADQWQILVVIHAVAVALVSTDKERTALVV